MASEKLYAQYRMLTGEKKDFKRKNPILQDGQPAKEYEIKNGVKKNTRMKIGDGVTPWNNLPYVAGFGDAGDDISQTVENNHQQLVYAGYYVLIEIKGNVVFTSPDDVCVLTASLRKDNEVIEGITFRWTSSEDESYAVEGNEVIVTAASVKKSAVYTCLAYQDESLICRDKVHFFNMTQELFSDGYLFLSQSEVQYFGSSGDKTGYFPDFTETPLFVSGRFYAGSSRDVFLEAEKDWEYRLAGEEEFTSCLSRDDVFEELSASLRLFGNLMDTEHRALTIRCTATYEEYEQVFEATLRLSAQELAAGYTVVLSNEYQVFLCDSEGNIDSGEHEKMTTTASVYRGTTLLSPSENTMPGFYHMNMRQGPSGTRIREDTTVTPTKLSLPSGTGLPESGAYVLDFFCENNLDVVTKKWLFEKSRKGVKPFDIPAKRVTMTATGGQTFPYNEAGVFIGSSISLSASADGLDDSEKSTIRWQVKTGDYFADVPGVTGVGPVVLTPDTLSSVNIENSWKDNELVVRALYNASVYDLMSFYKLYDGQGEEIAFLSCPDGTIFLNDEPLSLVGTFQKGDTDLSLGPETIFSFTYWYREGHELPIPNNWLGENKNVLQVPSSACENVLTISMIISYRGHDYEQRVRLHRFGAEYQSRVTSSCGATYTRQTGQVVLTQTMFRNDRVFLPDKEWLKTHCFVWYRTTSDEAIPNSNSQVLTLPGDEIVSGEIFTCEVRNIETDSSGNEIAGEKLLTVADFSLTLDATGSLYDKINEVNETLKSQIIQTEDSIKGYVREQTTVFRDKEDGTKEQVSMKDILAELEISVGQIKSTISSVENFISGEGDSTIRQKISEMIQSDDSIRIQFSELLKKTEDNKDILQEYQNWIQFNSTAAGDKSAIEIGNSGSDIKLKIDNNSIAFVQKTTDADGNDVDTKISWWETGKFHSSDAVFEHSVKIGKYQWQSKPGPSSDSDVMIDDDAIALVYVG